MSKVKMDIPYFQTPNNIFDTDLTTQELLVYIYLCRCGNHGGQAFPSYLTIANKCKMSRSSALRAVKSLHEKHLLSKRKRPRSNKDNDTNIYYVLPPPSVREELPSVTQTPAPSVSGTPPSVRETPRKRTTEKEIDIYKEPSIKEGDNSSSFFDSFLNMWKRAYFFNLRKEPEITETDRTYIQMLVDQGITELELHALLKEYFGKKRHKYSLSGLLKNTA